MKPIRPQIPQNKNTRPQNPRIPNTLSSKYSNHNSQPYSSHYYNQQYESQYHSQSQSQSQLQYQYQQQSQQQSYYNHQYQQQQEQQEQQQSEFQGTSYQDQEFCEDGCDDADVQEFVSHGMRARKPYITRKVYIMPYLKTTHNPTPMQHTSRSNTTLIEKDRKQTKNMIKLSSNKKNKPEIPVKPSQQEDILPSKLKIKHINQRKNTNIQQNAHKDKYEDRINKNTHCSNQMEIISQDHTNKKNNTKMMAFTNSVNLVIPNTLHSRQLNNGSKELSQINNSKVSQVFQEYSSGAGQNVQQLQKSNNIQTAASTNYQSKTNQNNEPKPYPVQKQNPKEAPQVPPVPSVPSVPPVAPAQSQVLSSQNCTSTHSQLSSTANVIKSTASPLENSERIQPGQFNMPVDPNLAMQSASMPLIQQSYLNKIMSQMMIQNNQYLHRVNESVVNRLLSIIENNANTSTISYSSSMKNSQLRQSSSYNSTKKPPFNSHPHHPHSLTHNKSRSHQQIQPQQQAQFLQKSCQKQESNQRKPVVEPVYNFGSAALDSTIKLQEIEIGVLENKRNFRKGREFARNRNHNKYSEDITSQNNTNPNIVNRHSVQLESQTQTPRPQPLSQTTKFLPTPSPIQHLQFQSQLHTQNITPSVSHQGSICSNFSDLKPINLNANVNGNASATVLINPFEKKKVKAQEKDKGCKIDNSQNANNNNNNNSSNNTNNTNNNNSEKVQRKPVFMEIGKGEDDQLQQNTGISLAEAFKRKIGKLPTRQQRKAKQQQQQQESQQVSKAPMLKNTQLTVSETKSQPTLKKSKTHQPPTKPITIDTNVLKQSSSINCSYITPKSRQPSEQLLNRLIYGSKAKISKKQMYALTKKNYENLPEVLEKKKNQEKRVKEAMRLERIKEYQKSIRASKVTIASNNN